MIIKKFKQYLNESIERDNHRKVLFVDEHGKNIVYDNNNYRIAVDSITDARYITLWFKKTIKDKEEWIKIGVLDAWVSTMNFKNRKGKYLSIRSIEIDRNHRNKGYGSKMYKALFDFCSKDVRGVYSYLPNRVNKKQIPKIYRKFGGLVEDGDYQFIDFK